MQTARPTPAISPDPPRHPALASRPRDLCSAYRPRATCLARRTALPAAMRMGESSTPLSATGAVDAARPALHERPTATAPRPRWSRRRTTAVVPRARTIPFVVRPTRSRRLPWRRTASSRATRVWRNSVSTDVGQETFRGAKAGPRTSGAPRGCAYTPPTKSGCFGPTIRRPAGRLRRGPRCWRIRGARVAGSRPESAVNTRGVLSERRRRFPQVLKDDEGGLRRETHRTAISGDTSEHRQAAVEGNGR